MCCNIENDRISIYNDFFNLLSLVNQLHYNELYDLYRDDYKLLKNENSKQIDQNSTVIKLLPGYQNITYKKKYVSCQTWHPTIPGIIIKIKECLIRLDNLRFSGIFAVSYMFNSNKLYKSVSLETSTEEITVKDEKCGISYSGDETNNESQNNQPESKFVHENYKEKIMSFLNKEFIQVYIYFIMIKRKQRLNT